MLHQPNMRKEEADNMEDVDMERSGTSIDSGAEVDSVNDDI